MLFRSVGGFTGMREGLQAGGRFYRHAGGFTGRREGLHAGGRVYWQVGGLHLGGDVYWQKERTFTLATLLKMKI